MMTRFPFLSCVAGALASAFAACGGSTTNLGSDSQAKDAGASSSSSSGGSGTVSDAEASTGVGCGYMHAENLGDVYKKCEGGLYCDHGAGACRALGVCRPITAPPATGDCAALVQVCGCDGKDYCDADDAQRNGVDVADFAGGCKFACGPDECDGVREYCEHGSGGVQLPDGGTNQQWSCKTLPSTCDAANRTCACLKDAMISYGACSVMAGHVRVEQFFP